MRITVLIEAIVVGIMCIVLGLLLQLIILRNKQEEYGSLILFLFVLGFLIHLLCELTGINTWYCKNGSACFENVHPASV